MQDAEIMLIFFGIAVATAVVAGVAQLLQRRELTERDRARATALRRVRAGTPDARWDEVGEHAVTEGLRVRFLRHRGPGARVRMLTPSWRGREVPSHCVDEEVEFTLKPDFETHTLRARKWAAVIRLRGTGSMVGKRVELEILFLRKELVGCSLEPETHQPRDDDAWIDVELVELLEL